MSSNSARTARSKHHPPSFSQHVPTRDRADAAVFRLPALLLLVELDSNALHRIAEVVGGGEVLALADLLPGLDEPLDILVGRGSPLGLALADESQRIARLGTLWTMDRARPAAAEATAEAAAEAAAASGDAAASALQLGKHFGCSVWALCCLERCLDKSLCGVGTRKTSEVEAHAAVLNPSNRPCIAAAHLDL